MKWTAEEDEMLRRYVAEGMSWRDITVRMGLAWPKGGGASAAYNRAIRIGLHKPKPHVRKPHVLGGTYIDTPPSDRPWNSYPGFFWGAFTFDRLAWLYGPQRAQQIRAGHDPATQADVAAWNRLGRKAAA